MWFLGHQLNNSAASDSLLPDGTVIKYIHLFTEAKKLAYEDRAKYYSDPAFNKLPIKQLISKAYAQKRQKLIQADRAARTDRKSVV